MIKLVFSDLLLIWRNNTPKKSAIGREKAAESSAGISLPNNPRITLVISPNTDTTKKDRIIQSLICSSDAIGWIFLVRNVSFNISSISWSILFNLSISLINNWHLTIDYQVNSPWYDDIEGIFGQICLALLSSILLLFLTNKNTIYQRLKTPLKTWNCLKGLDSRLRGNDKLLSIYTMPTCVLARRKVDIAELFTSPILKGLIFPVVYDPSTILISSSVNSYNS